MEESVKVDICRCCLSETGEMKNMLDTVFFDQKKPIITYFEGYIKCSGIESKSEHIYKNICRQCEKTLKISYGFRELCWQSNEVLQERINLLDVKTEVLSDSEDVGPSNFVYSEEPDSANDESQYRHQVFVQEKSSVKLIVPVTKIKSEEAPAKSITIKEPTPEPKTPENINVEVVLKEEKPTLTNQNEDQDQYSDDDRQMDDYDSYDDDDDVKEEAKEKKHKTSKKRHSYEDENMDIFLLEGNFACPLCELVLNNFRDFKSHRKSHLWDSGLNFIKRTCELCNKYTDKYLYHVKYEHPEHKPNSCRQCDLTFNQPNQLHRHLLTHLEGKRFPCKGCSQKFANTIQLKAHITKVKHKTYLYQCPDCGMPFSTFTPFMKHFTETHFEDSNNRKFYPCFACKNIFYRRTQAQKHNCDPLYSITVANMNEKEFVRTQGRTPKQKKKKKKSKEDKKCDNNSVEKTYECDRCSEKFSTEDEMLCHQYSLCSAKERYTCKSCNIDFKKESYLRSHNRNMHEERVNICDVCGSTWATERILRYHQTMVHGKRTFKCEECGATFKNASAVKLHTKIHQVQQQYECYHCKKKLGSLASLERHMVRHMMYLEATHKCGFCEKTFKLLVDKRDHERFHQRPTFPCHLCNKVYSHQGGLRHHVEFIHNGIRYNCNVCNQSLADRRQLYEHFFLHRGFKPYQCTACSRQEVKKDRFKKHLKQHNIKFDDKLHGYVEQDPNIFKIIDECIKTTTRKLAKNAGTEPDASEASSSRQPDPPPISGYEDHRQQMSGTDNATHSSHLPPLHQMCPEYQTY